MEGKGPLRVRVIDQVAMMVTREAVLEILPSEGELKADLEKDLLKTSLITSERKIFTGFIRGLGMKKGALAASNGWGDFWLTTPAIPFLRMSENGLVDIRKGEVVALTFAQRPKPG